MATLTFDRVDDWVRSDVLSSGFAGAMSVVALVRRNATTDWHSIVGAQSPTTPGFAFEFKPLHQLWYYNASTGSASTTTIGMADTDWWVVGVNKALATATPRFHFKNITTGGAVIHEDGTVSLGNPVNIDGGYFKIGSYDNTPGNPGSADDDYGGNIALVAMWDGVELSDAQFNECYANLRSSDIWLNSAGFPTVMVELTSTSPEELGAYAGGWTVTGAVATGPNPPGWVFDAKGDELPVIQPIAPMGAVTPIA